MTEAIEPGAALQPHQTAIAIAPLDALRVELQLDESAAAALDIGAQVELIYADDPSETIYTGTVEFVSRIPEDGSYSVRVKPEVAPERLGLTVYVRTPDWFRTGCSQSPQRRSGIRLPHPRGRRLQRTRQARGGPGMAGVGGLHPNAGLIPRRMIPIRSGTAEIVSHIPEDGNYKVRIKPETAPNQRLRLVVYIRAPD